MNTNSQSKHTPGPWKKVGLYVEADHFPILNAITNNLGTRSEAMTQAHANADLAAAAPELLEAAKYALSEDPGDWKSKLGFAIAKAEGK